MIRATVLALALGASSASRHEAFMEYIHASRDGKADTSGHTTLQRTTYPSRSSAELEAAAKEAPKDFVPNQVAVSNTKERPARRLQGGDCPDQFYVIGSTTESFTGDHYGAYSNPIEIIPGCPYSVELAPIKAIYLYVPDMDVRNDEDRLPMLLWSWTVVAENGETPINFFSLRGQGAYRDGSSGTFWDWYYWPLLLEDTVIFREDNFYSQDYYHCYSFCAYTTESCGACGPNDLRETNDKLYITTSSYFTSETLTVTNVADKEYSNPNINEDELNVIKAMYNDMCAPWQAPTDWSWDSYQVVESDAEGEADWANKPYCDWWFNATSEKVNALTTSDCLMIPGVLCDEEGHVSDMIIDTKGMRGPLPSGFDALTHLKYLILVNNRMNGPLPMHIFDSPELVRVDLYGNKFTGEIPCPSSTENLLLELTLANNELTGVVPDCLFTDMPEMTVFDMSRNLFDTPVPSSVSMASKLTAFYMQHAGVTGTVESIHDLAAIGNMDLSHNFLTGEMSQAFIDGMPRLYNIDLSWNQLTGTMPIMGESSDFLRRIHLDHNMLTGTITDQFTTFAANQDRGALSELFLGANSFCGELPYIFYTLLMDSHYFIYNFDVAQNKFHCSIEGNNMYWPNWAMGITEDFGMCVPIPVVTGVESATYTVDRDAAMPTTVVLMGEFVQTTEGTCKFFYSNGDSAIVPAVFGSTSVVHCDLPADAPEGVTSVTVAHYCADYASATTLADFVEITFVVQEGDLSGSSSKKKTKTSMAAVIGGVVGAVLAVLFLIFIFFMCRRERQGKPLFAPLKDTENPLYLDDKGATGAVADEKADK